MGLKIVKIYSDFSIKDLDQAKKYIAGKFLNKYQYELLVVMIAAHGNNKDEIFDRENKSYRLC